MNCVVPVYKPKGMTPLQAIECVRKRIPKYAEETIGYAGRLDPLAHGVLLLMIGDATKDRDIYLHLSKAYEFEVLFGIQTDSHDLLGVPSPTVISIQPGIQTSIETFMQHHLGKQIQSYPAYSSKAVHGKPLFQWAKENKLDEIVIPQREIEITQFSVMKYRTMTKKTVQTNVHKAITNVSGNFRHKDIASAWSNLLEHTRQQTFFTARFRIHCSSGTYVRQLVQKMGEETGTGAVTLDILRTQVGDYTTKDALVLE